MQMWTNIWNFVREFVQINVIEQLKGIRVIDVIDILALTFILYFLYRFIRDRRAGKLLIGLVCVFVLSLLGDAFNMPALRFVLSDIRQLGVIAILILFQPELRSALEKVGGTPLSGIRNITGDTRDISALNAEIDALCSAASDLSRDKVGALIAIERSTKLGEYIKSGVFIDATLSPYVLRNIFFNKAPLHDGAVIIRGGRVCAAGCFLPLSTQNDIDKDLGTRHRAALGLSEASDAIVIVVSEETGWISLAIDGKLERNFNYNTLKQRLNTLLASENVGSHKKHRKKH